MRWRLIAVAVISMAVFGAPAAHASVIQETPNNIGLVGYWSFNEGTSTIAHDFSGNGNNGTLSGSPVPQWVPGKLSQALQFNGTSYVSLSSSPVSNLAGPNSACMWAKTSDISLLTGNGYSQTLLNIYDGSGNGIRVTMGTISGGESVNGVIALSSTANGTVGTNSTEFSNNVWAFVCYTYNGSTFSLYVNGQSVPLQSDEAYGISNNNVIGARDTSNDGQWSGVIDEVRIYNRALSAIEVAGLYQVGSVKLNSPQSPGTLSSGLVGWWTMDGGDTVWSSATAGYELDHSGNGNTGTLTNMSRATSPTIGKIGQALSFDGVSSYIQTANNSGYTSPSQPLTISFWMKPSDNGSAGYILLATGLDSSPWDGIWLGYGPGFGSGTTNSINFGEGDIYGSRFYAYTANGSVPTNTWTHVVVVYNGNDSASGISVYLNGTAASLTTYSNSISTFTNRSWYIGASHSPDGFFNGTIDDVRVYNRALSASEIQQLYGLGAGTHVNTSSTNLQNGSSLTSGLVGLWTFDGSDISGSTIKDLSGNGNNATNYGAVPTIGKLGQGMQFDGVSSYVDIPNASSLEPAAITVSAWVNASSNAAVTTCGGNSTYKNQYILNKSNTRTGNFEGYSFNAYTSGSQIVYSFLITSSGGVADEIDSSAYNLNQWHHLVGVFQQPTESFYVDGVLVNTFTHNYPLDYGTHDVFLGRSGECGGVGYGNWDGYFVGKLDDVRIYNRALSASEVQQLYRMGK